MDLYQYHLLLKWRITMDEPNNENEGTDIQDVVNANYPQGEKETIVIKEKSDKFLILLLVFVLLITVGFAYLAYSTTSKPLFDYSIQKMDEGNLLFSEKTGDAYYLETTQKIAYDYNIQGINGVTIIFNQKTGDAYYPETGIKISTDDYSKKREGQIFQDITTIPASTNLAVSVQAKASEGFILYSIDLSLLESKIPLLGEEKDQKIESLRDSSNDNAIWLNFYDKDDFLLFSKKIAIISRTKIVNSNGFGEGLNLES
jgi:hypothetical protein